MRCRGCGLEIELGGGRRVGFMEACDACGTDLHSCVHCQHHDPSAYNACREPSAERVSDRERANRCEYFFPGTAAPGDPSSARDKARADLDALFGKKGQETDSES